MNFLTEWKDFLYEEAEMQEDNESVIAWLALPIDIEQNIRDLQDKITKLAKKNKIKITTDDESDLEPHITLLYIGKCKQPDKAFKILQDTCKEIEADKLKIVDIDYFDNDKTVCVAKVEGDWLDELHWRYRIALEDAGIDYEHSFPKYKAHITLQYLEPNARLELKIPKNWEWTPKSISFSDSKGTKEVAL